MPRKDKGEKKSRGSGGGGNMAAMFGIGMNPELDVSDADLEAELLALEGKAPKKKGGHSSKAGQERMTMEQLDKMVAGLDKIGDDDDDDDGDDDGGGDLSDMDDDELLGELQDLEAAMDMPTPAPVPQQTTPTAKITPTPAPRKPPQPPHNGNTVAKTTTGGSVVSEVSERLDLYIRAVQQAEGAGESSKVRRYRRSITTLEQMLKSAKAGKTVNLEELPPPVFVKDAGATPTQDTKPQPSPPKKPRQQPPPTVPGSNLINLNAPEFDEFNLTDEELATMAASLVDDRKQQSIPPPSQPGSESKSIPQSQSGSNAASGAPIAKPQPKPRSTNPPPSQSSQAKTDHSKPLPKPLPQQQQHKPAPATKPGGLIDLDDPEFDEFNLTEEDLAAFSSIIVDDRQSKQNPKADNSLPPQASSLEPKRPLPPIQKQQIFPPVPTKSLPSVLTKTVTTDSDKSVLRSLLTERMEQYQAAAKGQKDATKNREYKIIAARFSRVAKALDSGQEIDLNQMPGPPPGYVSEYTVDLKSFAPRTTSASASKLANASVQGQGLEVGGQSQSSVSRSLGGESSRGSASEQSDGPVDSSIPTPKTPLEALEQRLAKYREGQRTAQDKGESSRVRRMNRIIKQYEDAIKSTKAGKPVDYNDLPTPPGYPPIPVGRPVKQAPAAGVPQPTQSLYLPRSPGMAKVVPSISQEQIKFLEQRLFELKKAAKLEQTRNNKQAALDHMRRAKGLENMLQAALGGMPVNLEQVPPSPFADVSKTKPASDVMASLQPAGEKDGEVFELIIKQLQKQIEVCKTNAATYKKMGSNASAIEYENISQNCQRELLALKGIQTQGYAPPKFSLETRTFTIVHSNSYINSNSCEVEITKIINLTCPPKYEEKDLDVYVEVEFPYPVDDVPKKSTPIIRKTCNPEFKEQMLFEIDRKHPRSVTRAFKRTPLKCTVWQQRTLRKPIFIGLANIPLEPLEHKSEIHSTLDLLDERGRKPVGGKLEAYIRLREPITGRDQEEREEQWLVFKEAIAAKSSVPMPQFTKSAPSKQGGGAGGGGPNYALLSPVKVESTTSVAALKVEFSLVSSALKAGHKDGQTVQRGKLIKSRLDSIQQRLQSDAKFKQAYPKQVAKEMKQEQLIEAQLAKQGKSKQAEVLILQKRRAAMEKEVKEMQGR